MPESSELAPPKGGASSSHPYGTIPLMRQGDPDSTVRTVHACILVALAKRRRSFVLCHYMNEGVGQEKCRLRHIIPEEEELFQHRDFGPESDQVLVHDGRGCFIS